MSDPCEPRRRKRRLAALAIAAPLALAACTGPSAQQPGDTGPIATKKTDGPMRIAVVAHGTPGDAFWNVVKNGAEAAGKDLDVRVEYNSDGDAGNQAKLIDNAVAQQVDGLVVSMSNPDALRTAVTGAVRAGIPVITINSGEKRSAEFGAMTHVGQSEEVAGEAAGARLKQAGRTRLLCVIHEAGNIGLSQRCDGAKRMFGDVRNLQVDINNPTDVQSRLRGALQTDSSIDAVLTLNPQAAALAVTASKGAGSRAQVSTFDLNADVVAAIKAGEIQFAVDQQQYEQGYLPVVFLKLYRDNANTVGGGRPVFTGPGFVDKSTVDTVGGYAQRGTR
ncbi:monosaccharide ABC transporter substrate-binding protein (CUT2 family) [Herbihabitans rhizosphaerae]|uniref:Monosaccharide ABC transporter substrate-binding protein (CUT2 family) n=1 Tax=Herbihabitans rhizosphaerae TaxID=1872711 RepID=A0A4Q7KKL5_9PSEU|nr:sugar ABC transporter substrate-binding protein [Herbihabitans rhizosphaerae]RZS36420.1 monosaccharide ABC transporter substrate-binding protein (CUT2 family) [Herbihabitans rhizosphaerae]